MNRRVGNSFLLISFVISSPFGFVALLRTAAAVYPRKAAGCDMRSIRYGVDSLVREVA